MGKTSRITYRFVTGHHLDGQRRTDARAFHRGTRVIHPSGHAGKWSHLSRIERSAIRLGTLTALSGGTAAYVAAPAATIDALFALGAAGTFETGRRTRNAVRKRKHYREWVRPLHLALTPLVGHPYGMRADQYLKVPIDYSTNDEARIEVRFPEGFAGTDKVLKHNIQCAITEKLGMSDVITEWHTAGNKPYMTLRLTPRPPGRVTWSDALSLIEAAPESAPIIGIGPRNVTVSVDVDTDAPHILVSASTGGGKSVIVRAVLIQFLHNGARGIILDAKRHSHRWARGLESVEYCRSTEEIHNALIAAAMVGEHRNVLIDEGGDEATADLERIVIVCEEMNATITRLQRYWEDVRDKTDAKRSPAIDALNDILFMGRACKINVIAVAQMMTARTLGGPEARENFAVRILARYTRNAWQMLVPEIQPMPRSSRHSGRAQVCIAGTATETQVIFPSDKEARRWAESGKVAPAARASVPTSQRVSQPASQGTGSHSVPEDYGTLALVPPLDVRPELAGVTLSQAIDDGVISVSLVVARKASTRDPEFPEPVGKAGLANLYDPAELMRWQRNRPRAVS
jgi:hypothetical protein